ncbi:MAG: PDZ domain-containing protein, partial [Pseudomonadota bacterium]
GDVIGVNTAIISPTGGSIGIGFAVPADIALPIIDQLMKYGETRRGWLGVNIQSITDDLAASLGVSDKKGALVSSVRKGSPADKGGLKAGDVILKFDDKVVANMRALPRIVARTAHGKEVNVDIIRKGNRESLKIVVGRLEEGDPKKKKTKEKKESKAKEKEPSNKLVLGMSLSVLDDQLRKKYKLGAKKRGLVVTEVKTGSPAATKLLVAGQVIVAADQKPMFKLSDLVNAIASVKERGRPSILLRVEDSSGNLRFVALPVT